MTGMARPRFLPLPPMGGEGRGEGAWNLMLARPTAHYESSLTPEGAPGPLTALSRYLAPLRPGLGVLLWGAPLRALAAAAAAWGAARQAPVLVVDAANRFDPYRLVREARSLGLDRRAALQKVRVARAFTSHQLVRLLQEELLRELPPGGLVLLLGPVSLFYDEQVPLAERRRLFRYLTRLLAAVKARDALLLLQPPLPQGAANRHFGRLLAPTMDYFVEVGSREEDQGEAIHRPAPALCPPLSRRGRSCTAFSRAQRGDF
jgi:hypothetical protein